MIIKILILGLSSLFLLTPVFNQKPSVDEEQGYIDKVMQIPLIFTISKEEAEEAWKRIKSFIEKYSLMEIQVATDYVIETYNASGTLTDYGYSATKKVYGDKVELEVKCSCGSLLRKEDAKKNAHILAYYALTRKIKPHFINRKSP